MRLGKVLPAPLRRSLQRLSLGIWLPLRDRYLGRITPRRSLAEIQNYWRSPDADNAPETYATEEGRARSEFVVSLVERFASRDATILEVGCNVGRNLEFLRRAGWRSLSGIEINRDAVALMETTYPDLAASSTIHVGTAEDVIPTLQDGAFDVLFTMAVLEHIHPASDWVFAHFPRIARLVITVEDERRSHRRLFHRNYRRVFTSLGMVQVHGQRCDDVRGLGSDFFARVFTSNGAGTIPQR